MYYSFPDLETVCSMSSSNCCFLTCIQISQEAGQVVWYSHFLKNFLQFFVIHKVKGFAVVNKAEVVFPELSCFFDDTMDVGNLSSGSSVFPNSSLNIWNFIVHILLKPGLENFEHYFASMWDECNCAVVWAFFGIVFLWDWNENTFLNPVATAEFSKFAGILRTALSQCHQEGVIFENVYCRKLRNMEFGGDRLEYWNLQWNQSVTEL